MDGLDVAHADLVGAHVEGGGEIAVRLEGDAAKEAVILREHDGAAVGVDGEKDARVGEVAVEILGLVRAMLEKRG